MIKKTLQLVAQGIITGLTVALVIFFLIEYMGSKERSEPHTDIKKHYAIENVDFSDSAPSTLEGAYETTVTFKVKNENKNELVRVFVDIEFFDADGVFLFDYHHGSPWGELYLPPRAEDNISIDVTIPETVKFDSIAKVNVELYELSK